MKTQALFNETVGKLLVRVFGEETDELTEEFFRLNPTQKTLFLASKQWVNLPDINAEPSVSDAKEVIDLWE